MLRLHIHPNNPQTRLIQQTVNALNDDQLIIIPSESCYMFACKISSKTAWQRIEQLYGKHADIDYSILCSSLSEMANYAMLDNQQFRTVKAHTPSAIEFILPAQKAVPKHLRDDKKDSIAVCYSSHQIGQMLIELLAEPLVICPVMMSDDEPLADPEDIVLQLEKRVDILLDTGYGVPVRSTRVDLSSDEYQIIHYGIGDIQF